MTNLRRLLTRKPGVTPTDGQVPVYDAATDHHRYEGMTGGSTLHEDLTDVAADQHHTRYTDAEAIAAVGTAASSPALKVYLYQNFK